MQKDLYNERVAPYLDRIRGMRLSMTEAQIMKAMRIGKTAWYRYKAEHEELRDALQKGRDDLVAELKSVLAMRARGFHYTETKTIFDGDGNIIKREVYDRYCPPDQAAASMILKTTTRTGTMTTPQRLSSSGSRSRSCSRRPTMRPTTKEAQHGHCIRFYCGQGPRPGPAQ